MLFLGGAHQLFHLAPVAAALSRIAPRTKVTCIASDSHTAELLSEIRDRTGSPRMAIEMIETPRWGRNLASFFHRHSLEKLALLASLAGRLSKVRAIVTPERTSAWLRVFGLTQAKMIHFRHGAGDRAPSSEKRLKAFDLIVVPGQKDIERAVDTHHIDRDRLRSGGYVKLDYLRNMPTLHERFFDNDRPVVLYNPHFDTSISSWNHAEQVIERIRADGRYNLIVAPHIRIAEDMDEAEIARWAAMAEKDRIIVDLSSDRLIDMTYVRAADIYLGDMSSQLYEFLAEPRPVAFINAHAADWRDDPRFAGWHLGEVAEKPEALIATLDAAVADHATVIERQRAAVARAFGDIDGACERAAHIVVDAIADEVSVPARASKVSFA